MGFLSNLWNKIAGFLGSLDIDKLLKRIFTQAVKLLLAQLWEIAEAAIKEAAQTGLSNEEKRKLAFENIKKIVGEKGLEARDSLINLVIELAIAHFKNRGISL